MADKLKNDGNAALSAGNYTEAIRCYTEAIKLSPLKEYYSNRSLAYLKLGKFNDALADGEQCVKLDANWGKGYQRKGAALQSLNRYKDAFETLKKGLELEPGNTQMKASCSEVEKLAQWEESQHKKEEAAKKQLAELQKLFEGDPLGQCRLMPEVKDLVDDVGFVKKISEIQNDPTKLQHYIATDEQVRMFVSVAAQYQHLSKLTDKERAELYLKQEEARMRAEKLEEEERDRRRKEEKARKEEEERKKKLEEESKLTIEQRKARDLKEEGNNFFKKKDFEKALELYQQASERDPTNIVYYNNIAAALLELKNYDKCIEVATKAIEIGRENRASFEFIARAMQRLGSAYLKKEDYPTAITHFRSSLTEHRDKDTLNLLLKAQKLLEDKEKREYINPELSAKAKDEGNDFFKKGQFAQAVDRYSEAIKRDPGNYVLYTNRATALTKLGAFGDALKDCDKCIELNPKFIKAYLKKGNVYFVTKQYQKCLDVYGVALEIEPDNAEIQEAMNKAIDQISRGQDKESVKRNLENSPELQAILRDPMMQQVLQAIKNKEPLEGYLKDPKILQNLEELMKAGVIGTGRVPSGDV
eukprot:TRINITY_DN16028_c0_g1_i1.p1 TRINITY_DN16028_c0_g1~~TRINITY_DN16028_c0_g1_i1.p1  ORF type:complete len:587 (-),score=151.01 TRINITY_DN16028_c0_g1_i1:105-1865(-)